jgi:dTDP-4-amino-4,6-dideoxygalactose transaminase
LHNVGRKKGGEWYEHIRQGWNYRMTEWQAAILIPQLERARGLADQRECNARRLTQGLNQIPGIRPTRCDPRVTAHAWHIYIFCYQAEAFGGRGRDEFLQALRAEGIPCAKGYLPLNQSPALEDGLQRLRKLIGDLPPVNPCPAAEKIALSEAVWLGQNLLLGSEADIDDIIAAVGKVYACFQ